MKVLSSLNYTGTTFRFVTTSVTGVSTMMEVSVEMGSAGFSDAKTKHPSRLSVLLLREATMVRALLL